MGLRLCLIGFMFGFTLTNRLDFNHTDKVVILYIYIYNLTQKIILRSGTNQIAIIYIYILCLGWLCMCNIYIYTFSNASWALASVPALSHPRTCLWSGSTLLLISWNHSSKRNSAVAIFTHTLGLSFKHHLFGCHFEMGKERNNGYWIQGKTLVVEFFWWPKTIGPASLANPARK